ncbi:MAG TPA: UDP-N-acetylmuramoyl-L-alanyl-D-glutamate--2,6-diaminopimelate ligase [Steroidobacteraceae bacterium]|nr:UDP-N-acetylmuramoyl-L-alanyl-D-glutamate--2,6-diaminopimelate ligase [Steroidobacteraceae bacterium]
MSLASTATSSVSPAARALAPVLRGIVEVPEDLTASELTLDSRTVRPGAAFLACRGRAHHGLEFAQRAAHAGARVILWESAPQVVPPPLDASIVVREVPDLHGKLGVIADRFYDAPSAHLVVDAVTGTNGKTTCAWLLAQALGLLGRRSAYLGTLGVVSFGAGAAGAAVAGGDADDADDAGDAGDAGAPRPLRVLSHTTPDVLTLHRLLAQLLAAGVESVAMEVSSHALDQERCAGVRLHAAAFTNLTRDHLDYHGDMSAYGAAKARLLEWPALAARIVNVDDDFGRALARRFLAAAEAGGRPVRLLVTSQHPAQGFGAAESVCAADVTASREGLVLRVQTPRGDARLSSPLRGRFNADNLLTVLALLLARGVPLERACDALSRCQPPPGRMQPEGGGAAPLALIDYAHTPDALAQALAAARALCTGHLWCVFGCGGERDRGKRAEMGRIAAAGADRIIVTDDNPRGEDPAQITTAILQGITAAGAAARARVIHDRGAAIRAALGEAGPPDVVLVAGKGHEEYQLVGDERREFSDSAAVRAALASRRAV